MKDISYEYTFDNDNQVKALEFLGKNLALWTDKVDVNGTVTSVNIIDDIPIGSDDDGG